MTPTRLRLAALSLIIVLSGLAFSSNAQLAKGRKSFGPRVGYVSRNNSASAGLAFEYAFSRHVRIAPEAQIVFRHNDLDAFVLNADVHFPIAFAGERAAFFPLVGANFTSWGRHTLSGDDAKDVTSHTNVFGLNVGAGIEYYCKPSLKLSLDARYTLVEHYPGAFVTAGISFVF